MRSAKPVPTGASMIGPPLPPRYKPSRVMTRLSLNLSAPLTAARCHFSLHLRLAKKQVELIGTLKKQAVDQGDVGKLEVQY